MNALLELIDQFLNSLLVFFNSSNLQMFLLIGTGLLTIGLLFLALTRWGHSRPLWKCVVLSVTAHILLLGYAYGTRLLVQPIKNVASADSAADSDAAALELRIVDQQSEQKEIEQRIKSERMSWNDFGQEQSVTPQLDPLPRPQIDSEILTRRETPGALAAMAIDRFTPMPKPAEVPQRKPKVAAVAQPVRKIPAVPAQDLVGELKASPAEEQAATPAPNTDFIDAMFAAESEAAQNAAGETATELENPLRHESGSFAVAPSEQNFVTANRSTPRIGDGKPTPGLYELRSSTNRLQVLEARGGSIKTEQAVEAALLWLANHQDKDGRWDASKYGGGTETKVFGHDRDGAGANADTGISGLALLSFLAGGHSHLKGPWQETVREGLRFLISQQDSTGSLAGEARLFARMYCHSMALLAVSEAYALTGDDELREVVRRGVNYSLDAQHRYDGGWRYQPGDDGDMSQFGWQALSIHSAELAGIDIPQDSLDKMNMFIDSCATRKGGGVAAYRPRHAPSMTMTAESLVSRYMLGQNVSDRIVREAKAEITSEMPSAERPNLYYWYYGTMALYFAGGTEWEQWNEQMKSVLLSSQQRDGDLQGSWAPDGVWASYGGRVYSTAMSALILEVYYRYLPTTQQPNERFAAQDELAR